MVKGRSSPDDPVLAEYWATRRRKTGPELIVERHSQRLLRNQRGRCALCGGLLLPADRQPETPEDWEHWFAATRKEIMKTILFDGHGPPDDQELRLIHHACRRRIGKPATAAAYEPSGLA